MIIHDETYIEDHQSTVKDKPPQFDPNGLGVGRPAPPVGRLAYEAHQTVPASYVGAPPPLRINLSRVSRSVRIKSPDASLPRIHGPIGCLVPLEKEPPTSSKRIILSHLNHLRDQPEKNRVDLQYLKALV